MSDDLDLLKRLVAQVSRQGDHHTLLTRQLKKAGIADSSVLPEQAAWEKLVKLVDDSYRENDRDRYTLERSLALCSDEMQELQGKLQKQNSVLNQVVTRYVSEEVATEILKDPDKKLQLGGEMMLVSYLHVRISAPSTQKSRDARLVFKTLNRLFQHVVPMVLDGHGTFDKYLGDALLCFFGAPVAHDDDAFRAVRTAVRMRSAIEDLIDGSQDLLDVATGTAIATGFGVVGNVGTERLMNYTCIGDAPATASLLQEHAKPGEILICATTYEAAHESIRAELTEPITLRGRHAPIQAYRVLGLR